MAADLGSRVLIADGDSAWRQRLFSRLLELDIFSDCVANGQDALHQLEQIVYAVVVLDLELPGVDALDVLARIARMPARPVVLVTAAAQAARSLDLEVVQMVVRKPVDLEPFAELVRRCVRTVSAPRGVVGPAGERGPDRVRA